MEKSKVEFGHALIFGGTGMLTKATVWIAKHANKTTVYGRNEIKLKKLEEQYSEIGIQTRKLNYQETQNLRKEIQLAIEENGPVRTVIAWIHSTAPDALSTLEKEITKLQGEKWTFIIIKGSNSKLIKSDFPTSFEIKEIQLGFIYDGTSSRWLTHEEISNGVIKGIVSKNKQTLIGTLTPWEKRP
ncbi:Rossmann-fold NAD(P)-binding domain-containing protein [Sutcliffiella rhizosphaerae]|uniref:Short-chain dehydrogenase n=1 Tax=Sutcliffiella rhizosphaerae TaxID=2880967 RepID=A0ABN8ABU6_9BACI|nr:short-chain dehydrogenase [Sutcliffiella rhizosphaerae]CAG9622678.1 hypothetical protein BACCIP111883_03469 [Sutcliffiella rhizosphaerae]